MLLKALAPIIAFIIGIVTLALDYSWRDQSKKFQNLVYYLVSLQLIFLLLSISIVVIDDRDSEARRVGLMRQLEHLELQSKLNFENGQRDSSDLGRRIDHMKNAYDRQSSIMAVGIKQVLQLLADKSCLNEPTADVAINDTIKRMEARLTARSQRTPSCRQRDVELLGIKGYGIVTGPASITNVKSTEPVQMKLVRHGDDRNWPECSNPAGYGLLQTSVDLPAAHILCMKAANDHAMVTWYECSN